LGAAIYTRLKGADELNAMGWLKCSQTFLMLTFVFSQSVWALNLDFEKEIQRREIVSVRLAQDLKPSKKSLTGKKTRKNALQPRKSTRTQSSSSFKVKLTPVRR